MIRIHSNFSSSNLSKKNLANYEDAFSKTVSVRWFYDNIYFDVILTVVISIANQYSVN